MNTAKNQIPAYYPETLTQYKLTSDVKKIIKKIKLKPTTVIVLTELTRYYPNIFPAQKKLATECNLSLRSITNAIDELVKNNLIITAGGVGESLRYLFTPKFFEIIDFAQPISKTCVTPYAKCAYPPKLETQLTQDVKPSILSLTNNTNKQTNNKIIHTEKVVPIQTKNENDEIFKILNSWGFEFGFVAIKKHGIEKIKKTMEIVEKLNPSNKGAYLRKILKNPVPQEQFQAEKKPKYHSDCHIKGMSYPNVNEVMKESESVKVGSPLDLSEDRAKAWLNNLPKFLEKSYFAREVRKKWGWVENNARKN